MALTILITGASTGIGADMTLTLASLGHRVYAGVRNEKDYESYLAKNLPGLTPIILDITKDEQVQKAVLMINVKGDGLDILINNAGYVLSGPFESISIKQMQGQLDVNFLGPFRLVKAFLTELKKSKGKIINIGSTSGLLSWPFSGAYSASKFALDGWTQALRLELSYLDIAVVNISTGAVTAHIWDKATSGFDDMMENYPQYARSLAKTRTFIEKGISRAISPSEVTNTVLEVIAAQYPRDLYLVGPSAHFQYFIAKILPRNLFSWLKMKLIIRKD